MSPTSGESLRRTPTQDRSAQRLELILDTTARLIDEVGYAVTTPAMIAREAGMSGPAVYRYFADLDGILTALSDRIRARFLERVGTILADDSVTWELGVEGAVDVYVDMYLHEPAFRAFRPTTWKGTSGCTHGYWNRSAIRLGSWKRRLMRRISP